MKYNQVLKMTTCGLFTALGVLLPTFFHFLNLGQAFLPMHIPVLLCGLICGGFYGAICGLITPLLSSALTGMPPLFPVGTVMAFELMAYGLLSGLLLSFFSKHKNIKSIAIPLSLVASMLIGRCVYGSVGAILYSINGKFTFGIFLTSAFANAIPGIILQLLLIPSIMYTLENCKILLKYRKRAF